MISLLHPLKNQHTLIARPLAFVSTIALSAVTLSACRNLSALATQPDTSAIPSTVTSAKPQYIATRSITHNSANNIASPTVPPASGPQPQNAVHDSDHALSMVQTPIKWPQERTASCSRTHCWRSWMIPRLNEMQQSALPCAWLEPVPATRANSSKSNDKSTPLGPVAVWQEHLRANVKLTFPRTKNLSLIGVVLQGVVTVQPSEGGQLAALKPWSVFSASGAGTTLNTDAHDASVILIAYSREGTLEQAFAKLRKSETGVYWKKRPDVWLTDDLERVVPKPMDPQGVLLESDKTLSAPAHLQLLLADKNVSLAPVPPDKQQVIFALQGKATVQLHPAKSNSKSDAPRPHALKNEIALPIVLPPDQTVSIAPSSPLVAVRVMVQKLSD